MSIGTDKVSDSVIKFTKNTEFFLSLVLYPGTRVFYGTTGYLGAMKTVIIFWFRSLLDVNHVRPIRSNFFRNISVYF
jgi:hypothetical protein